jgi:hypothetical protein
MAPPLSVISAIRRISPVALSVIASSGDSPASAPASTIASSTAASASCWLGVVAMCQNSYLEQ